VAVWYRAGRRRGRWISLTSNTDGHLRNDGATASLELAPSVSGEFGPRPNGARATRGRWVKALLIGAVSLTSRDQEG